jgi:hypothetical protein
MKRFWMFALLLAGSLAVLTVPTLAIAAEDMDDINEGMGVLSSRISDVEKGLGIKFKGDLRFRGENFLQDDDAIGSGMKHRYRTRVRVRFGAEKKIGSEVKAYLRLATGGTEATSTNQTLTGDALDKGIFLDQAAIEFAPNLFENKVVFRGGKIANPLDITAITWDGDVNPEGASLGIMPDANTDFNFMYFILQENSTAWEPYLVSVQLSRKFKIEDVDLKLLVGGEVVPEINTTKHTPWLSYASAGMVTNLVTGKIPDIVMGEAMLTIKHKVGDVPLSWTFHGALNTNSFDITNTTVAGMPAGKTLSNQLAFLGKVSVGKSDPGMWAAGVEFAFIEPNAVYGIFSDSDSGSAGYNNNVWIKPSVEVGLADGLTFSVAQYLDWKLYYDYLAAQSHQPVLRTQIDAVVKL